MTGILGFFGSPLDEVSEDILLAHLRKRGGDATTVRRRPDATIASVHNDWQAKSSAFATEFESVALVADASLYYFDDLRRGLAAVGCHMDRECAAAAVCAAYSAWGENAARFLEGDFAFALWDSRRRRLFCARDFGGKRPLYYAVVEKNLVVASSVAAIAALPAVSARLNLAVIAETCSHLWTSPGDTCYLDVHELPAGATLTWSPNDEPRVRRHWEVPRIGEAQGVRLDEGIQELRRLLVGATKERLDQDAPTAVWMSGGWDSTSVFASGQAAIRDGGSSRQALRPVSISYPEGDPGREDELINTIAKRWDARVHWLYVDQIPLFGEAETQAAVRELPFAHTYEHWNRALARGARAVGARVALDGNGGDQLFQISDVFLSDLLRAGRFSSLMREWRTKRGKGLGTFFDWVIAPALPSVVKRNVLPLTRRRSADDLTRPIPSWIRRSFVTRHALHERQRSQIPSRSGYRGWRKEAYFFLAASMFPAGFRCLADLALAEGVELRSPLYDKRVIEFGCQRPREERSTGRETKRLLRAAMRGLLPEEVLAPRSRRTGITTAYSDRRMRSEFPGLLERHGRMPVLADLGIVEPELVRKGWEEYCRTGNTAIKIALFLTMQVELWLECNMSNEKVARRDVATRAPSFAMRD